MSDFKSKLSTNYTKWYQSEIANNEVYEYGEHNSGTYAYLNLYGQNYSLKELEDFLNRTDVAGWEWSKGFEDGIKKYIQERRDELLKAWTED